MFDADQGQWEEKSVQQVIADVKRLRDSISAGKESAGYFAAPTVMSERMLRGPSKFRNRKRRKAWAQSLQKMFSPRMCLGEWKKFMDGEDFPHRYIIDVKGVQHV